MTLKNKQIKLQVLWIDDEWEKQDDFIGEAEQLNIDIKPAESHEEGMEFINDRPDFYHAVVLDAKVKLNKDSQKSDLNGLRESRDKLIEINQTKYLPWYIFTGQPDYYDHDIFRESYGEFYIKGRDNKKVLEAIITSSEKHPEIQVKKEFPNSFDCFDCGILGHNVKARFVDIVTDYLKEDFSDFNRQRKLLEDIFKALGGNPIPLIPLVYFDENGKPILEHCVRFIDGRKQSRGVEQIWIEDAKKFPRSISALFRKLKDSSTIKSHSGDQVDLKVPYIGNIYAFAEILPWLTKYVDEHYKNYI